MNTIQVTERSSTIASFVVFLVALVCLITVACWVFTKPPPPIVVSDAEPFTADDLNAGIGDRLVDDARDALRELKNHER